MNTRNDKHTDFLNADLEEELRDSITNKETPRAKEIISLIQASQLPLLVRPWLGARDDEGRSFLQIAVKVGASEIARDLLAIHQANLQYQVIFAPDANGCNVLHLSIKAGDVDMLASLLECAKGSDLEPWSEIQNNRTLLMEAVFAQSNRAEMVRVLLAALKDKKDEEDILKHTDHDGKTVLAYAMENQWQDHHVIATLLKYKQCFFTDDKQITFYVQKFINLREKTQRSIFLLLDEETKSCIFQFYRSVIVVERDTCEIYVIRKFIALAKLYSLTAGLMAQLEFGALIPIPFERQVLTADLLEEMPNFPARLDQVRQEINQQHEQFISWYQAEHQVSITEIDYNQFLKPPFQQAIAADARSYFFLKPAARLTYYLFCDTQGLKYLSSFIKSEILDAFNSLVRKKVFKEGWMSVDDIIDVCARSTTENRQFRVIEKIDTILFDANNLALYQAGKIDPRLLAKAILKTPAALGPIVALLSDKGIAAYRAQLVTLQQIKSCITRTAAERLVAIVLKNAKSQVKSAGVSVDVDVTQTLNKLSLDLHILLEKAKKHRKSKLNECTPQINLLIKLLDFWIEHADHIITNKPRYISFFVQTMLQAASIILTRRAYMNLHTKINDEFALKVILQCANFEAIITGGLSQSVDFFTMDGAFVDIEMVDKRLEQIKSKVSGNQAEIEGQENFAESRWFGYIDKMIKQYLEFKISFRLFWNDNISDLSDSWKNQNIERLKKIINIISKYSGRTETAIVDKHLMGALVLIKFEIIINGAHVGSFLCKLISDLLQSKAHMTQDKEITCLMALHDFAKYTFFIPELDVDQSSLMEDVKSRCMAIIETLRKSDDAYKRLLPPISNK